MLYSSGTTGQPKGILPAVAPRPFGTGLNIDHTMKNSFGFSPATVFLCTGPLYHGAPVGWSLGTIRNGGTAIVMERFDAALALSLIERFQVTHAQFVATMFVRMLKLPEAERAAFDTSSLRLVELPRLPSGKMLRRLLMDRYRPCPLS
jgi:acyl-coenzyme A synthetase/AMP-(fatty) acid ligase